MPKFHSIRLFLAALIVAGSGLLVAGTAQAQNVPNGSYKQSCRNIHVQGSDDLAAECRRSNGTWRNTKIDLDSCRGRDITNVNGDLECGGHRYAKSYGRYQPPAGSWNQSCRNSMIRGDDLVAECRQRDGGYNRTSIDLDDCRGKPVSNDNGRLRCGETAQGGANTMPRGTWAQSCRNAQVRGDDLYAQCRDRKGQWHNTRIDLDRCPNRGLINDNGELRCS